MNTTQIPRNSFKTKLSREDFTKVIYHCSDTERITTLVDELKKADMESCSPGSVIALYLIQDLFSEASSDEANINRITTNLEAIAEDLYTTSRFIKALS